MRIGITCYPTYGGSGVVATELGKELATKTIADDLVSRVRKVPGVRHVTDILRVGQAKRDQAAA